MNTLLKIAALALPAPRRRHPQAIAQTDYFTNWPPARRRRMSASVLAEHFIPAPIRAREPSSTANAPLGTAPSPSLNSPTTTPRQRLIDKFAPLMPGGAEAARIPVRHHVDATPSSASSPSKSACKPRTPSISPMGQSWADRQWENPPARRPLG